VKVGDKYNLKGFGRITIKSLDDEMVVVSGGGLDLTIKKIRLLSMGKRL
tara:strand:+ start:65398 stop:65544 length:147 start_codon:yes stop_codon:yes gene_type:complete